MITETRGGCNEKPECMRVRAIDDNYLSLELKSPGWRGIMRGRERSGDKFNISGRKKESAMDALWSGCAVAVQSPGIGAENGTRTNRGDQSGEAARSGDREDDGKPNYSCRGFADHGYWRKD